jgi:hypothetical protein
MPVFKVLAAAAFFAAFFMQSAHANMFCFPSMEVAKSEAAKHGETLRFSVVMSIGALAHVYASEKSMTILIQQPNGMVCTGPALIGEIIRHEREPCA